MLMKLIPHLTPLGNILSAAFRHYVMLKEAGQEASVEILTVYLHEKMAGWAPKVGDTELLDEPTREAGARFLAGIVVKAGGL